MWFVLHSMLWKRKLFLILLVSITLLVAPTAYYVCKNVKKIFIEETQSKAIDIAVSIAAFLVLDIEYYRTLSETTVMASDNPYYLQANSVLRTIKEQTDTSFIYTFKYIDDQTKAYVLDAEDPLSELFSPFGSLDTLNSAERQVHETARIHASGIVENPIWGAHLTGYAPIIDPRDTTLVGWVGVDYDADSLTTRYTHVSWVLGICFLFFILIFVVILYVVIVSIQNKANTDYLTKLGNKRAFSKTLELLCRDAEHFNKPFALLILDIDKFKVINDTYGHPAGDAVLQRIAETLVAALGSSSGCFRYGGDEFTVLLPSCTLHKAVLKKDDIHQEVDALQVEKILNHHLSVSIGMAMWEQGKSIQDMVDKADQDLYREKQGHRES